MIEYRGNLDEAKVIDLVQLNQLNGAIKVSFDNPVTKPKANRMLFTK